MPETIHDTPPDAPKPRRIWPIFLIAFLCVIVGVAVGAGILWYRTLEALTLPFKSAFFVPEQVRVTESLVVNRIREVAKIVTVEYHMADVIDYQNDRMWPLRDTRAIVIARAKVLAGFNLTDGDMEIAIREPADSTETKKTAPLIRITLPPPEIIAIEPTYQYYDLEGKIPLDIHNWILLRARNQLKKAAIEAGILERAKESMRVQVAGMFPGAEVAIRFSTSRQDISGRDDREATATPAMKPAPIDN